MPVGIPRCRRAHLEPIHHVGAWDNPINHLISPDIGLGPAGVANQPKSICCNMGNGPTWCVVGDTKTHPRAKFSAAAPLDCWPVGWVYYVVVVGRSLEPECFFDSTALSIMQLHVAKFGIPDPERRPHMIVSRPIRGAYYLLVIPMRFSSCVRAALHP